MIPLLVIGGKKIERENKLAELLKDRKVLETLDGEEGSIKIEEVRRFQNHISLKFRPEDKVALVIREGQSLTHAAQNALLKTLEELPESISVFISADRENNLLPTVLSRCRILSLEARLAEATADDSVELALLLKLVAGGMIGQLFSISESWIKAGSALENLEKLAHFLLERSRNKPSPARAKAIKLVLGCLADLETNVNKQLALEHLFLELWRLTGSN